MRLPPPAKSDAQNALHEAGHAVAGYAFRIQILEVSLIPEEPGEDGYVRFSFAHNNPQDTSRRVEVFIKDISGYAAERKAGYENLSGWGKTDKNNLERCIPELKKRGVVKEGAEIDFLRWIKRQARALMDENWTAVQKFAEVLKEKRRMSGTKAEQLCERLGVQRRNDDTLLARWFAEQEAQQSGEAR